MGAAGWRPAVVHDPVAEDSDSSSSDTDDEVVFPEAEKLSSFWLDAVEGGGGGGTLPRPAPPAPVVDNGGGSAGGSGGSGGGGSAGSGGGGTGAGKQNAKAEAFDVVIVGAGLAGVSVAHWLREEGFSGSLCLVDARGLARYASARNGGHCWVTDNSPFMLRAFDAVANTARALGVPFDLIGGVDMLRKAKDLDRYDAVDRQAPAEVWNSVRVQRELPMLRPGKFHAGVFQRCAARMSTCAFVRALYANLSPPPTFLRRTVIGHDVHKGELYLTDGRVLQGRRLVFATNALTRELLPEVPIEPVRGQALHLEVLDPVKTPLPKVALNINESFEYAQPWGERGLVFGGARLDLEERNVRDDSSINPKVSQRIRWRLLRTLQLRPEDYRVTHEWSGIMGFTPDEEPLVGPLPTAPQHLLTCGFSGEGVIKGFAAGRCVAQLLQQGGLWAQTEQEREEREERRRQRQRQGQQQQHPGGLEERGDRPTHRRAQQEEAGGVADDAPATARETAARAAGAVAAVAQVSPATGGGAAATKAATPRDAKAAGDRGGTDTGGGAGVGARGDTDTTGGSCGDGEKHGDLKERTAKDEGRDTGRKAVGAEDEGMGGTSGVPEGPGDQAHEQERGTEAEKAEMAMKGGGDVGGGGTGGTGGSSAAGGAGAAAEEKRGKVGEGEEEAEEEGQELPLPAWFWPVPPAWQTCRGMVPKYYWDLTGVNTVAERKVSCLRCKIAAARGLLCCKKQKKKRPPRQRRWQGDEAGEDGGARGDEGTGQPEAGE